MKTKLIIILALFVCSLARAAVTVCASGCNTTTITSAKGTATATPNSVIQLNDNSIANEAVTFGPVNTSLTIQGINNAITWTSTSASAVNLGISNGLLSPITVQNITLQHTTGNSTCLFWFSLGAGSSLYFKNVNFVQKATQSTAIISVALSQANQLTFDKCLFDYTGGSLATGTFSSSNAITTSDAIVFKNCLINAHGVANTIGIKFADSSNPTNNIIDIYQTTIANCAGSGVTANGGVKCSNSLFLTNVGLGLSGGATVNNFDHCLFLDAAQTGVYGAGCIFSGTVARETISGLLTGPDYHLWPTAQSVGAGVSISGVNDGTTTDLDGINWNQGNSSYDLGCYKYILPPGNKYIGR